MCLHEAAAVGVEEHGAIAADGLGDEEGAGYRERCGVELIELEVGELRARTQRHGDAIAGGHGRVGGVQVELARSTAGQNDGVRVDVVRARCLQTRPADRNLLITKNEVAWRRYVPSPGCRQRERRGPMPARW